MQSREIKSISNKVKESFNCTTAILKKSLGKGAFGQCFEIEWQEKPETECLRMALKFIPGEIYKTKKELFNREITIHQKMFHRYVVRLSHVSTNSVSEDVHMIMELCSQGSLADYITNNGPSGLRPSQINRICSGICRGLIYLHQDQVIVHRDIKPANILLNDRLSPKISDFGLAASPEQCFQTRQKICGTPHYLAPEIFHQAGHSFQSDIWAFGITLFFMISGYTPFESKQYSQKRGTCNKSSSMQQTISQVYQNVIRGKYKFPKAAALCSKQYIKSILLKDPLKRPTLNQLSEHKFYPTKNHYAETPDDENYDPSNSFQLSIDSIIFISDQPVLDGIKILSQRFLHNIRTTEDIVWINRWAMKTLFELFYSLSNQSYGGNLLSLKGIVITSSGKETHFHQDEATLQSSIASKLEELSSSSVKHYGEIIIQMLNPFLISPKILNDLLNTIKCPSVNGINEADANVFVYKWFFHGESIIFLLSNGCWQICFFDHTKLLVVDNVAIVFGALSEVFEIISIEKWCIDNTAYLDVMRTLIYSIL